MKTQEIAQWAEVISSIAILATLIVLIMDLRANTEVLERQAALDRANVVSNPVFQDPRLAAASAKIRAVDGPNEIQLALEQTYQLTEEEAFVWARHLGLIWFGIQADFNSNPESRELKTYVCALMESPDVAIHWDKGLKPNSGPDFIEFIESCQ